MIMGAVSKGLIRVTGNSCTFTRVILCQASLNGSVLELLGENVRELGHRCFVTPVCTYTQSDAKQMHMYKKKNSITL